MKDLRTHEPAKNIMYVVTPEELFMGSVVKIPSSYEVPFDLQEDSYRTILPANLPIT
jgi:hypothetical protein